MWNELSMSDKAEYIAMAVKEGIMNLDSIRSAYDKKDNEDYLKWKESVEKHKGINIDNDPTYDYEGYYSNNPEAAWGIVRESPEAHFTDKFKTALHPSFSEESRYSGTKNKYNPKGIRGGRWIDDTNYVMSEDMLNDTDYDVSRTRQYFKEAESSPVTIYAPDGSIMLDPVTVTADRKAKKRYDDGGLLSKIARFIGWSSDDKKDDKKKEPDRFTRKKSNDSPTKQRSEKIENVIASTQKRSIAAEKKKGIDSEGYYIPYTDEEIKIPGIGRVSANTLDSIFVNAERADIPVSDALGLAAIETKLGASPNTSTDAFKKNYRAKYKRDPSSQEIAEYERAALNASYMRNFGGIYPQFLINDHDWTSRGWEESPKYKDLENISSPLQHGFTLFKKGIYNTGDKSHTKKVKTEGKRLMNVPVVQARYQSYKKKKKQ